ncbi:MAG: energy transducer TonB [Desulfobulbaceae bacterium]|nr:energy transducer TonB [Desulfobulbaceae bacterium]
MKRLLWAGAIAVALHGALLLMKFGSHSQQPRPLPQGISLTLTAVPQEERQATESSKPPPITKDDKPAVKPAVRPKSPPKPIAPKKTEETQPVAISSMATGEERMTTGGPSPSLQQSKEEQQQQPGANSLTTLPAAGPQSASGTEQAAIEATPLYRRNPPPDYPPLARRRGLEGTVQLDVLVNSRGDVNQVRLAETSGHDLLDRAAIAAVENWLFQPGKRGDETIDMWVRVPIRFALHD